MGLIPGILFPFIRFTNWKQALAEIPTEQFSQDVSIHTLHELEASRELGDLEISNLKEIVSIHTLHELEARLQAKQAEDSFNKVSIHTLHELEASPRARVGTALE